MPDVEPTKERAAPVVLKRLLAGAPTRKSRLHSERGVRISLWSLTRNAPRAIASGFARLLFGWRPKRPWISYDAQKVLADRLGPNSRVLEFGSGMSTIWYAAHAGAVVSLEHFEPWYRRVDALLRRRRLRNVQYRLDPDMNGYTRPTAVEAENGFDLIMVDGVARERCVANSLNLLRPGGAIYLDNSDQGVGGNGDLPSARRLLLDFAAEVGGEVQIFTDFAPTQLFVQEGLMVTLPAR